ncbi:MAG: hypothetical protein Q9213_001998 [Squamulea squamosa]
MAPSLEAGARIFLQLAEKLEEENLGIVITQRYQRTFEADEQQILRDIGAGSCGTVFEWVGKSQVVKYSKDSWSLDPSIQLYNDYRRHTLFEQAFKWVDKHNLGPLQIRIPKLFSFVAKDDTSWWDVNIHRFPEQYQVPSNLLVTERILPLPQPFRHALIDRYCPENAREAAKADRLNKDALVRLLVGKRRIPRRRTFQFSLRNYGLHEDQMEELNLDPTIFSAPMAEVLAVLHWVARSDAKDIEIVLGSSASESEYGPLPEFSALPDEQPPNFKATTWNFKQRTLHVWALDFNQCTDITMDHKGVAKAVNAFYINDQYFPRPPIDEKERANRAAWQAFMDRYLRFSQLIIKALVTLGGPHGYSTDDMLSLPTLFIEELELERHRRAKRAREAEERTRDLPPPID